MILFINSSDLHKVQFALITDKSVKKQSLKIPYEENYKTLEYLNKFLKKSKIANLKPLNHIIISSGPGSFTGLRVAASIAQSFKLALGIPVTVIKKNKIPANLKKLLLVKVGKDLELDYGRPAVY